MNLVPTIVLSSVTDITPGWMDSRGLRGLLLDLDNTLAPYHCNFACTEIRKWLSSMSAYRLIVLSNSKRPRVHAFCARLGLPYVADAKKPCVKAAVEACERYGLSVSETAIVGDQIFTDVLCANSAGLLSVLVEPLKRGFLVNFRRNIIESRHVGRGGKL